MKADLKELAIGYTMLSDKTRVGILQALVGGPQSVTRLIKTLKLRQPTVSHHLGILRMGRMVIATRKGKQVIYETDKAALKALGAGIANFMPK